MMRYIILVVFILNASFCYTQEKIKVACVGNSVTYGAGLDNRELESYPAQLQVMLGNKYEVRNFGKSGTTLLSLGHRPYIKQEEYQKALEFDADIVVIHLGLNDTDPRDWPHYRDSFIADYYNLIDSFKEKNSSIRIYICKLTPIFDGHRRFKSGTYTWYWQIQDAIEKIAHNRDVGLIDLNEDLACRPDLFPDFIHPTKQGAEILAKRVYASLSGDFGGLKLAPIYSSNMIIQRDCPINIKGKADSFAEISVVLGKEKKKTKSDFQGNWSVVFPSRRADKRGVNLTVNSKRKELTFENIKFGDVWLCSGQSNMAFRLKGAEGYETILKKLNPNIHICNIQAIAQTNNEEWEKDILTKVNDLEYFEYSTWEQINRENILEFSAVATYFGNMLADSLDVPIGLVLNAVGGSNLESWMPRRLMEKHPLLVNALSDFITNDFIQDWCRGRAKKNIAKSENQKAQRHPYQPAYLFESGTQQLVDFQFKGLIWYQGESNAHNAEYYDVLFNAFVESYRDLFGTNLPIIYAQLSSVNRPSWPIFRDTQRRLQDQHTNLGMVVTSDVGDSLDVHPKKKKEVGERMALWALNSLYGYECVTPSGPLYNSHIIKSDRIEIGFRFGDNLHAANSREIIGFEIAGDDFIFYPAIVKVVENKVELSSKQVKAPKAARYAWQPYTRANLVNAANLPASTFKTY